MRGLFFILSVLAVCEATVTTISAWPGFSDMPTCAQCPLDSADCIGNDVWVQLKCSSDGCLCNRFPQALSLAISLASASSCSPGDISSATSILSAYCRQVPSITFEFNGVPNTNAPAATAAGPTNAVATQTTIGAVQTAAPAATTAEGIPLLKFADVVTVTSIAVNTYTTTDSYGDVSVVTSFEFRSAPTFKSDARSTYQGISPLWMAFWGTVIGFTVPACFALLWTG
jgi:hypothetical protein